VSLSLRSPSDLSLLALTLRALACNAVPLSWADIRSGALGVALQEAQWPPHTPQSYLNVSARMAAWSAYEVGCSAPHYTRAGAYRSNRCELEHVGCPNHDAAMGAGPIALIVAAAAAATAVVVVSRPLSLGMRLNEPCRGREHAVHACSRRCLLAGRVWRVDTRVRRHQRGLGSFGGRQMQI
jgi:hypothetical protein